ncbi:hypothetical protein [Nocardia asteroides]|uniref:hypothetical protein n=1 Tax=Nocardia asteroides TaxID=1824 RepID=UPI0034340527
MTYPPQQGPGWAPNQGQPYGAPQQYPPQYGGQPDPRYAAQPFPSPEQAYQQGWGQPQPQRPNPFWKNPLVLAGAAVVLVGAVVVGLVAVSGGDDDKGTVAAVTSTAQAAPSSAAAAPATSTGKSTPTTSKAAAQTVSANAQAVLDAMPAPLRKVVAANKITEKEPVGSDTYKVRVVGTVPAKDALTEGLLKTIDIDRYPISWIDTDPDRLLRIWNSQHPDRLIDKGEKKIRIDTSIPGGGATVETFNTTTKLYSVMSGFKDKDSALKYVERAGF